MNLDHNSTLALYLQIAQMLENAIFEKIYEEEEKIPSTNELSKLLSINPHTVLKGMNVLVADNLIYKKRGLGMYVSTGAYEIISKKRKLEFFESNVNDFINQAKNLNINKNELISIIDKFYNNEES